MIKKIIILLFFCLFLLPLNVFAANIYYMANNPCSGNFGWGNGSNSNNGLSKSAPFLTAQYAWTKMSPGDTLIIDDGEYGKDSCKGKSNIIPQGNSTVGYTVMKAENDGEVIINGGGLFDPLAIYGDDYIDGLQGTNASQDYIEIRGIVFKNSVSSVIKIGNVNHVKIINCGAVGSVDGANFGIIVRYSTYVLIEGCYVWGGEGKYRIATYHADHTVIRNCVARIDKVMQASNGLGAFSIYSSTNVEVQNCISIDSTTDNYWALGDMIGAFGAPTTTSSNNTGPIYFRNCIALNNHMRFCSVEWNAYPADVKYVNCIGWDIKTTGTGDFIHSQGSSDFSNCSFGEVNTGANTAVTYAYYNGWKSGNFNSTKNTIWYNFKNGGLFYDIESCSNNLIYGIDIGYSNNVNGTSVQNTKVYDPKTYGLKYITRREDGSKLETDNIGAEIIKMYGKPGSLWGDFGYNALQDGKNGQADLNLWPFPNEDVIRKRMREYSYDNGNLTGKRGFCADAKQRNGSDITLTSYIWEYLGNTMPTNIYVLPGKPTWE